MYGPYCMGYFSCSYRRNLRAYAAYRMQIFRGQLLVSSKTFPRIFFGITLYASFKMTCVPANIPACKAFQEKHFAKKNVTYSGCLDKAP
jgi:hypothetical protein